MDTWNIIIIVLLFLLSSEIYRIFKTKPEESPDKLDSNRKSSYSKWIDFGGEVYRIIMKKPVEEQTKVDSNHSFSLSKWFDSVVDSKIGNIITIVSVIFLIYFFFGRASESTIERGKDIISEVLHTKVTQLNNSFKVELPEAFFSSDVVLTYLDPRNYDKGTLHDTIGELTDVYLDVILTSKASVNEQRKTVSVSSWTKGQKLTVEGYNRGSIDIEDVGYKIIGNAKSGDDTVEIRQIGQF